MEFSLNNYNVQIVLILSIGFAFAAILGYFTQKIKLSPILGFLIAGFLIGPYSPGLVADLSVSEQLAEIGVVLMMFGVGMHFKWQELVNVKNVAIPGAITQTLVSTLIATYFITQLGWTIEAGIVIGISVGVASTVVMVRVLSDNNLLGTPQGHIAVGWLIVEDIITVIALILLPVLASSLNGESLSLSFILADVFMAIVKCALLVLFMAVIGMRVVSYIVFKIARTRSQELFTLTVLAIIFCIAIGSFLVFGTSIALGAFIAGMVIGQTEVKHQATANSLPIKDMFAVIFFLTVGMLFNPYSIYDNFTLFAGILAIVLLIKPLAAILLVLVLRYSFKTALLVAVALAQIGEFSFILSEQASKLDILPDEGYDAIVAAAIFSIALNPLLFNFINKISDYLETKPSLPFSSARETSVLFPKLPKGIVVGFGPIGQEVSDTLEKLGIVPVIIETNVDTIFRLTNEQKLAFYGDATVPHILESAHIDTAQIMVITTPDLSTTEAIIRTAKDLNPKMRIIARVSFKADADKISDEKVFLICAEEEAKKAFIDAVITLT